MEAQNLTVSVPPPQKGPICDKNCPYCISAMTGYIQPDKSTLIRNIDKAKTLARAANVSNIMLTGKGEPLLNFEIVCYLIERFREYPTEIQTNGLWLSKHPDAVSTLKGAGLDTIGISVDHLNQMDDFKSLIGMIQECNMTCRICLNLTDKISTELSFSSIFRTIKTFDIHQLLIRNIMIPQIVNYNTKRAAEAVKWIDDHVDPKIYKKLYIDFEAMIDRKRDLIRVLPHGAEVFNLQGIDVSFSDYCVQESNNTKDIRSLIFLEDGHMYTSWDKVPASRLF